MPDADAMLLAARCISGEADDAERGDLARRLAADPDLASWYDDQCLVAALLPPAGATERILARIDAHESSARRTERSVWGEINRRQRRRRMLAAAWVGLAASLVLGLALGFPGPSSSMGSVVSTGGPLISGPDGATRAEPAPGDRISYASGPGTLALGDGTHLRFTAGSEAILGEHPDPSSAGLPALRLRAGSVEVHAAHQHPGRRLVIAAPHLTATVVGTRFTLGSDPQGDRITVEEGIVEIVDAAGARQRIVAGGRASTDANGRIADGSGRDPSVIRLPFPAWPDKDPPRGEPVLARDDFSQWPELDRAVRFRDVVAGEGVWPGGWSANLWEPEATVRFRTGVAPAGGRALALEPVGTGHGMQIYNQPSRPLAMGASVAISIVYAGTPEVMGMAVLDVRMRNARIQTPEIRLPGAGDPTRWTRWDGSFRMPGPAMVPRVYLQHRGSGGTLWVRSLSMQVVGEAQPGF